MSIRNNFPTIRPSLNLDFANVKALDPRITFTRTTTATYYDGKTTAKAEENLLLYSQEFDNAAWIKTGTSVTANAETAPDGTTTADTATASATTAVHTVAQSFSTSSLARVISIFAKEGTHSYIQICVLGDATPFANFDLDLGVVGTKDASVTSSITSFGNGWYRCTMEYTSAAATRFECCLVSSDSAVRRESWTAAGTETVYLWGAQLEQRSAVTAYTPTTTQPITNYIPVLQTAASGVARFDHNPTTGESLGLLVEEQRTNLVLSSGDIANAYWAVARGTKEGAAAVSPDGSLTAMKLVEDTQTGPHHINRANVSFTSGLSYTLSGFYKAGERPRVRLNLGNNGTPFPNAPNHSGLFDLLTGTIVSQGSSVTSATITSVGNGWYRCSITATAQASATDTIFLGFLVQAGQTEASYTGDGFSGLFYWGAQLEQASFSTSYIPTVAATVTRNADVASMTGTNFSNWYNQAAGTLFVNAIEKPDTATRIFASITDGTTEGYAVATFNNTGRIRAQNVSSAGIGTTVTGQPFKIGHSFESGSQSGSLNGSAIVTTATTVTVVPAIMRIGTNQSGTSFWNSHISRIAYFPRRIANAQLQALTTV